MPSLPPSPNTSRHHQYARNSYTTTRNHRRMRSSTVNRTSIYVQSKKARSTRVADVAKISGFLLQPAVRPSTAATRMAGTSVRNTPLARSSIRPRQGPTIYPSSGRNILHSLQSVGQHLHHPTHFNNHQCAGTTHGNSYYNGYIKTRQSTPRYSQHIPPNYPYPDPPIHPSCTSMGDITSSESHGIDRCPDNSQQHPTGQPGLMQRRVSEK